MSDHHDEKAGHEVDQPPTRELFNIIWGLGALTLLSLATCVQLFNNQQRSILAERGKESSFILVEYREAMETLARGSGTVVVKDSSGVDISHSYVPLAVSRDQILAKPERLLASPSPKGWVHPDDIAAGVQAGSPPPAAPAQPTPPTDPAAPAGEAPANPSDVAPAGQPGHPAGQPLQPVPAGQPAGQPAQPAPAGQPAQPAGQPAAPAAPATPQPTPGEPAAPAGHSN